ncbi:MAG: hypothetical protein AAB876_00160 [Patescibacteria group bacterium]
MGAMCLQYAARAALPWRPQDRLRPEAQKAHAPQEAGLEPLSRSLAKNGNVPLTNASGRAKSPGRRRPEF